MHSVLPLAIYSASAVFSFSADSRASNCPLGRAVSSYIYDRNGGFGRCRRRGVSFLVRSRDASPWFGRRSILSLRPLAALLRQSWFLFSACLWRRLVVRRRVRMVACSGAAYLGLRVVLLGAAYRDYLRILWIICSPSSHRRLTMRWSERRPVVCRALVR